ncbi:hypothetical protein TNCV_4690631 [Trichonephila clavipes]|nr:hypothetical protein TNCV_4690631 [Trichonephila clavipes]
MITHHFLKAESSRIGSRHILVNFMSCLGLNSLGMNPIKQLWFHLGNPFCAAMLLSRNVYELRAYIVGEYLELSNTSEYLSAYCRINASPDADDFEDQRWPYFYINQVVRV